MCTYKSCAELCLIKNIHVVIHVYAVWIVKLTAFCSRVWSVRVTDGHLKKMPTLNARKNKWSDVMDWFMIYCEGYHQVSWKSIRLVAMVTYLNENQWTVPSHRVGDRYFALTSRYSIAIYILTTRFCLVLLIVNVSQINWLSCQLFGISKQALDFVRNGKILHPR